MPPQTPAPSDAPPATVASPVVVPTLYLTLLTDGRVAATKQSGLFQSGNATAKASASYRVTGLDKAFAQQLARVPRARRTFVKIA